MGRKLDSMPERDSASVPVAELLLELVVRTFGES
jgi:hypothetical protein